MNAVESYKFWQKATRTELSDGKADGEALRLYSENMKLKQQNETLRLKSIYPRPVGSKIWPDTRNRCPCYDDIPLAEWLGENQT